MKMSGWLRFHYTNPFLRETCIPGIFQNSYLMIVIIESSTQFILNSQHRHQHEKEILTTEVERHVWNGSSTISVIRETSAIKHSCRYWRSIHSMVQRKPSEWHWRPAGGRECVIAFYCTSGSRREGSIVPDSNAENTGEDKIVMALCREAAQTVQNIVTSLTETITENSFKSTLVKITQARLRLHYSLRQRGYVRPLLRPLWKSAMET